MHATGQNVAVRPGSQRFRPSRAVLIGRLARADLYRLRISKCFLFTFDRKRRVNISDPFK